MTSDDLLRNIRKRIDLCRNLAASCGDEKTAEALRQMADEGERDLNRALGAADPDRTPRGG